SAPRAASSRPVPTQATTLRSMHPATRRATEPPVRRDLPMQHHVAPHVLLAVMASACGARTPLDMPSAGADGGFGDAAVADDGGSGDSAIDVDASNPLPDSSFDF